jgi:hypothetical protein
MPISTSEWEINQTYHITWETTPNIANVKIDLYRNAVFIMEVVGSTPNDGDFLWIIADGLVDSTQYQFKISDAAYTLTSDDSEIFEIFNPSITVVEPVSTSAWSKGSSKDINWTSRGTIPNVKIELYKDGILELTISSLTSNDGVYLWNIPSNLTESSEYSIKIIDSSNSVTYDFSDNFAIVSPPGGIPGYNLWIFILGSIIGISIVLIRKRVTKK